MVAEPTTAQLSLPPPCSWESLSHSEPPSVLMPFADGPPMTTEPPRTSMALAIIELLVRTMASAGVPPEAWTSSELPAKRVPIAVIEAFTPRSATVAPYGTNVAGMLWYSPPSRCTVAFATPRACWATDSTTHSSSTTRPPSTSRRLRTRPPNTWVVAGGNTNPTSVSVCPAAGTNCVAPSVTAQNGLLEQNGENA